MSLKVLIQRVIRRWYCLLAGLLAVAGLCYWVGVHTPVQYRIQGSVVLLPSSETVGGGNPYLFLTGLGQAMDVVTRRLTAPSVREPIADTYPHTAYTAAADQTNGSSILLVSVTGDTESAARGVLSAVMAQVPKILVGMQDQLSVPPQGRIGSMPVTSQQEPTVDSKSRVQLLALSAVGGVALTLLLTALLDGLISKWTSRRGSRAPLARKSRLHRRPVGAPTTPDEEEASPLATEVGAGSLSELSR
ncbi:hypothetical protein [Sinomonas sp. RB5]